MTPILPQGGHEIYLDDRLLLSTIDRDFQRAGSFHNTATVPCTDILRGTRVRWEAFTQTHSLAILKRYPAVEDHQFFSYFLRQTANIIFPGTLVGLGILCFFIFLGKVETGLLVSLLVACFADAATFALFVPRAFQIRLPQAAVQSVCDIALWIGLVFTGRVIYLLGYSSKRLFQLLVSCCGTGIGIILLAGNLDQSQVGSNLAQLGGYIFLFGSLGNTKLRHHATKSQARMDHLKLLALLSFIVAILNDMFLLQFAIPSEPFAPFGIFCCMALLAMAVNEKVVEAYNERDYLRANLEKEVARKTEELKTAQADLVQSAKLVALGTLSAGIAHEINNALNFVNGSIDPLNNILKKEALSEGDKAKAGKLLGLMKEGLELTFAIIVNLKRHTNVSPGQEENLPVREVVEGTLLLLKNKLSGVTVVDEIDESLRMRASRVSLSQILMNLISNAVDAMESVEKKSLRIWGTETATSTTIAVTDSGMGITKEVKERIFDPFFTTKAVGKGTGLGLHIVLSEVKKINGKVEIESIPGEGATFLLTFPKETAVQVAA